MIFSIGGLVFNSVAGTGFEKLSRSFKGEYSELALVDGAMSVKRGIALNKQTFNAQWLGVTAGAHINDLLKLVKGKHQMSDQDGNNMGVWTVDSITDNGSDVLGGSFLCHNITLNLTEFR